MRDEQDLLAGVRRSEFSQQSRNSHGDVGLGFTLGIISAAIRELPSDSFLLRPILEYPRVDFDEKLFAL